MLKQFLQQPMLYGLCALLNFPVTCNEVSHVYITSKPGQLSLSLVHGHRKLSSVQKYTHVESGLMGILLELTVALTMDCNILHVPCVCVMRYVFVGGPAQSHEADMEPGQANDWNKDHYTHKQQYKPDSH